MHFLLSIRGRQLHEEYSYNCVQLSAVMCDLILVALQRNYTR